jgi:hypothetical protein
LSEKFPFSIGLHGSEFVNTTLSLVDLMGDPNELNKPEKKQPMFVQACVSTPYPFPCLPPTRRNCYALALLNRHLFHQENLFKSTLTEDAFNKESYASEFSEDFDYETLDKKAFEDIKKLWSKEDSTKKLNFDVNELKYLDIEALKTSEEFGVLNGAFISLFSHSLHRIMQTTKHLNPNFMKEIEKSILPPKLPFYSNSVQETESESLKRKRNEKETQNKKKK